MYSSSTLYIIINPAPVFLFYHDTAQLSLRGVNTYRYCLAKNPISFLFRWTNQMLLLMKSIHYPLNASPMPVKPAYTFYEMTAELSKACYD